MGFNVSSHRADLYTVDSNGCYIWHKLNADGYPVGGVHRIVCSVVHGIPDGVWHAHHKCENPSCVNPDHLEPHTGLDNNRLKRHTRVPVEDYDTIRARCAQGPWGIVKQIADEYGVTPSRISTIKNAK